LATVIENAAKKIAKKQARVREHELLVLNKQIGEDADDSATEMIDTIASSNNTSAKAEESAFIQDALALLTPLQQKVVLSTVLHDQKEKEVAEELGISQPAVHHIKRRALQKIRKHLIEKQED